MNDRARLFCFLVANMSDEYENIKGLVRALHGPSKNIARPPIKAQSMILPVGEGSEALLLPQRNSSSSSASLNSARIIPSGTSSPPSPLTAQQVSPGNFERHYKFPNDQQPPIHHIPSLIVTEPDHSNSSDHLHKLFSQFQSGLRRFSHSNTVIELRIACKNE